MGRAVLATPPAPVHPEQSEANMEQPTKICRRCDTAQPTSEFALARGRRDGHADWCKLCAQEWNRARYQAAPDVRRAQARASYQKRNADRIKARTAALEAQKAATAKACATCGEVKPLDDFYLNPKMRSGRNSYCKVCWRVRASAYHAEHRDRRNANQLEHYHANRDAINAERRAQRAADPEGHRLKKRAQNRRATFGLSPEQAADMLAAQDGRCAICGRDITGERPYRGSMRTETCVDHDHTTGATRALLCPGCNQGLGLMKDDPVLLRKAADYLDRFAL